MERIGPGAHAALIVVDVQVDFCPGGALGVEGGDEIVPVIGELVDRYPTVVFTRDRHPPDHCSFSDEPRYEDGSWPPHCVAGTPGAELHPDLRVPPGARVLDKGQDPDREQYSGFDDTDLADWLRDRGVDEVHVCGLTTEICVNDTAIDAKREGFEVVVLAHATRGIDRPRGSAAVVLDRLRTQDVRVVDAAPAPP